MLELFVYAVIVLITIMILLASINMSKIAGYAIYVDICITLALPIFFKGTFSGILTAAMAGLLLSITLHTYRWLYGFHMYNWRHRTWLYYPHKDQIQGINQEFKRSKTIEVNS